MSDDDRDIDIESDYDDDDAMSVGSSSYNSLASVNTQFMTQAEKRAHHNALERKRRDHIKDSFSSLRDSVPNMKGEKSKTSRAMILKKASDYIQYMKKKNSSHQQDIEDLKRQNQILDQQVRALEKAKATGTFASTNINAILINNTKRGNGSNGEAASEGSESSDSTPTTSTDLDSDLMHKSKKMKS